MLDGFTGTFREESGIVPVTPGETTISLFMLSESSDIPLPTTNFKGDPAGICSSGISFFPRYSTEMTNPLY